MRQQNILILIFLAIRAFSQPTLQWKNCYGGTQLDEVQSIITTQDNGLLLAGYTASSDGQVTGLHGESDMWVVKLDSMGNLKWQKALGGTKKDIAHAVIQDADGNFIVTGVSFSSDGDVAKNWGYEDVWVVKLSKSGNKIWQKVFGGSASEEGNAIISTADGGYLIAGYSSSADGDITVNKGFGDMLILKLSKNGALEWVKTYGGSSQDEANAIQATSDGGYVIGGKTWSEDGDVEGTHGDVDFWLIKIDSAGILEWQKPMGGLGTETIRSIAVTPDGGFVVLGESGSGNSGQITGAHGGFEAWMVKLDSAGEMEWQKPFGGSGPDYGRGILCTSSGKLVVAAASASKDWDVAGGTGEYQAWLFETNLSGDLSWQMPLGGSQYDRAQCVVQTPDGGLCFAGNTQSNDGDVTGNHGTQDIWVIKFAPETTGIQPIEPDSLVIYPNPTSDKIFFQGTLDGAARYEIRNSVGCVLKSGILSAQNGIQVQDLPVGIYGVSLVSVYGQRFFGRFLIQR